MQYKNPNYYVQVTFSWCKLCRQKVINNNIVTISYLHRDILKQPLNKLKER